MNPEDMGRFSGPALLILMSLAGAPRHGYAIMEDIRAVAGVHLGPGTLYGALARLEEQGLIRALPEATGRRRPYALTASGRATFTAYCEWSRRLSELGLSRLKELNLAW